MVQEQSLGEATGTPQRAGCYPSLNHTCIWHSAVRRPVLAALRERASPRPAASSKDRPDRPDRSDRPGRRFPGPSLPAMGHRLPAPGSEFRVSGSEFRLPGSRPPAPCSARPRRRPASAHGVSALPPPGRAATIPTWPEAHRAPPGRRATRRSRTASAGLSAATWRPASPAADRRRPGDRNVAPAPPKRRRNRYCVTNGPPGCRLPACQRQRGAAGRQAGRCAQCACLEKPYGVPDSAQGELVRPKLE